MGEDTGEQGSNEVLDADLSGTDKGEQGSNEVLDTDAGNGTDTGEQGSNEVLDPDTSPVVFFFVQITQTTQSAVHRLVVPSNDFGSSGLA